jgi:hypothetical protein
LKHKKKPVKLALGGRLGSQFSSASTEEDEGSPYWKKAGYPKWSTDNSSTVPNDPANQINRAKGEPNKVAPSVKISGGTKTVTDGSNSTQYSAESDPVLRHLGNTVPSIGNLGETKQHYPPCINPRCKSFGKSHPNCLCYAGPGGSSLEQGNFAHGGCVGDHLESCEHFASGGQVEDQQAFLSNPSRSLDHVAANQGLSHLLTKFGSNGQSPDPHKYLSDYVDSEKRGYKATKSNVKNIFGSEKLDFKPDKERREKLKQRLEELRQNPDQMLNLGGNLGQTLPGHAAALGYKSAQATNYLSGLRPKTTQNAPLDIPQPKDITAENKYNRALDLAENPHMILQHAKEGTIQPQDIQTVQTLYPALYQSMVEKSGEGLIDAKTQGQTLNRHQKQGLSRLMGQPLTTNQTPMAMQAILRANAPSQQTPQGKQPKKASGVELKQLNKTSEQSALPNQKRQLDQKD